MILGRAQAPTSAAAVAPRRPAPRRAVFFNRVYAPSEQATAVLLTSLCRALAAGGAAVQVVCAGAGAAAAEDAPVDVRRARWGGRPGPSLASRALAFAAYYLHALAWAVRLGPADAAVIWTDPPLLDTLLGNLLAARGVPYHVVVQDLYPQLLTATGLLADGAVLRGLTRLQRRSYRRAASLVCISEDTPPLLAAAGPLRLRVIENWSAARTRAPAAAAAAAEAYRRTTLREPRLVLRYGGNFGYAFDLATLAAALALMPEPRLCEIRLRGRGRKACAVHQLAAQFPGVVVEEAWLAAPAYASPPTDADFELILMPEALFGMVYPSKLYASLALGLPVCAVVPRGSAMWRLVERSGAGACSPASQPAALARTLERLATLKRTDPEALIGMRAAAAATPCGDPRAAAAAYAEALGLARPVPPEGVV